MAEIHMFPPNGKDQAPEAKIARLEAHVYHLWAKLRETEAEQHELKKDREALLRYILWRIVIFLGLLVGALASKGSTHGSLITAIFGALTSSVGQ